MRNVILFIVRVHVPVSLLVYLSFQGVRTSDELYRILSINWVYIHTALTYVALFVVPSVREIQPENTGRNRIGVIGFKFFVIASWFFYYRFFVDHIQGIDWFILGYVAFSTWVTWASSFLRLPNWFGFTKPVLGLVYELVLAGGAILAAYSLHNCGHTMTHWMWVAGIGINASLLWSQTITYLYQTKMLSEEKQLFYYLHGFPLFLFAVVLLYTTVMCT